MKKSLLILVTFCAMLVLESCNSHVQTGWTPYRTKPAYARSQKKSKLHHVKMGTTPLTKRHPTQ